MRFDDEADWDGSGRGAVMVIDDADGASTCDGELGMEDCLLEIFAQPLRITAVCPGDCSALIGLQSLVILTFKHPVNHLSQVLFLWFSPSLT